MRYLVKRTLFFPFECFWFLFLYFSQLFAEEFSQRIIHHYIFFASSLFVLFLYALALLVPAFNNQRSFPPSCIKNNGKLLMKTSVRIGKGAFYESLNKYFSSFFSTISGLLSFISLTFFTDSIPPSYLCWLLIFSLIKTIWLPSIDRN